MLDICPFIEFYSILINKKKIKVSQIQDKSRFVVTVFGDSKRMYRGSSFLDSARFSKYFHSASYKVFVLKVGFIILEKKLKRK